MNCPKCRTEVPPDSSKCPGCALVTPHGRKLEATEKEQKAQQKRAGKKLHSGNSFRKPKPQVDWKAINWKDPRSWRGLGAAIPSWSIYLAVGLFLFVGGYYAYGYIYEPAPKERAQTIHSAINQTKNRPSKKEGATLDQLLKETLTKSKEAGKLVSYQGWTVKDRENGSFMVTFAYQEDDGQKEASWLVDTPNNQFIPQTELAIAVSR